MQKFGIYSITSLLFLIFHILNQNDIYGSLMAAWSTANPFVALGWGAVSSAVGAGRQYFN